MPDHRECSTLSPDDRRREVASILAKGVIRWRKRARAARFMHAPQSSDPTEKGLEVSAETRLSVSDDPRGLWPRDDGDNA